MDTSSSDPDRGDAHDYDEWHQTTLLQGPLAPFLAVTGYLVEVRWNQDDAAMHVHSLQPGHNEAWRVTFPYELRQREHDGARFLVEKLTLVQPRARLEMFGIKYKAPAGHYRASGRIWRVVDGHCAEEVTPSRRRKHAP